MVTDKDPEEKTPRTDLVGVEDRMKEVVKSVNEVKYRIGHLKDRLIGDNAPKDEPATVKEKLPARKNRIDKLHVPMEDVFDAVTEIMKSLEYFESAL